jgi:hypothetical protein
MMKKMRYFVFIFFVVPFSNAVASSQCINSMGLEKVSCEKCLDAGNLVVQATKGAKTVTNIEPLTTWRASCAERPPVGVKGGLLALCDGDLVSQNGSKRKIFYWMHINTDQKKEIGYHLCPTVK